MPSSLFRSNTEAQEELFVQRSHSQQVGDSNSRFPTPVLGQCFFPGMKRQTHAQGTVLGFPEPGREKAGGASNPANNSHPQGSLWETAQRATVISSPGPATGLAAPTLAPKMMRVTWARCSP